MTRAIRIHRTGGPEVLALDEIEVSSKVSGRDVLIRHTAIGVNYIDTYHRTGLYPLPSLPHGIGMEAAGVVEAVGPDVMDFATGDRVAYATGAPGAYAEKRIVSADRLVKIPEGISDETAAAMMLKGMTVEYLIHRCFPVEPGQTVLFHAAAGGVGLIACQWLRHRGVTVIGTAGSAEKAELARAHGATHTIVYTEQDFVARVRELTDGLGVPVVFDSVGRATFMKSLDCLAPRGTYVGFGNASGKPDPFDMQILSTKGSLYLTRPTLMTYVAARDELALSAERLFDVVRGGVVKIDVRQRWPLAEASEAHRALEARKTIGSSVLLP